CTPGSRPPSGRRSKQCPDSLRLPCGREGPSEASARVVRVWFLASAHCCPGKIPRETSSNCDSLESGRFLLVDRTQHPLPISGLNLSRRTRRSRRPDKEKRVA